MRGRSVFEDVSSARAEPPAPGRRDPERRAARRAIRAWLWALAVLVVAIVLVGGLTRLTDSGLAITEWAPVMGAIPPLEEADWQAAFNAYRVTTEFQVQNSAMTLAEFKPMFWWEWGHRLLGRLVGVVWLAGFLCFAARRAIPAGWALRLALPGLLGGLQGAVGWWMVMSGLNGRVDVASYRLAVHLGLAFAIFALLVWLALRIGIGPAAALQARRRREQGVLGATTVLIAAVFVQLLSGALVAGIDAGRDFPEWPLMTADSFLPPEPFALVPLWTNFFENAGLVQFVHRMLGYLVLGLALALWLRGRRSGLARVRGAALLVLAAVLGQVALGVVTVMRAAPPEWALAHQAGALVVVAVLIGARFAAAYPAAERIARG